MTIFGANYLEVEKTIEANSLFGDVQEQWTKLSQTNKLSFL